MKAVKQYSDHFKRRVVQEAIAGDQLLVYYRRKYKIGGSMTLSRRIDKFAAETAINTSIMFKKQRYVDEISQLKAELALLRQRS